MSCSFKASREQKAIIEEDLVGQCVVACAGSGKTATAVRRLVEIRKRMGTSRQHAVLLSYSNVAVDTFRTEYAALTAASPIKLGRVLICTMDSFVISHILATHSARSMRCEKRPYLVQGHEPFLKGFTFFNGTYGEEIKNLTPRLDDSGNWQYFNTSKSSAPVVIDDSIALAAINKLGKTGAYTHDLGRYWALKTLAEQPHLVKVLSQRYPYILVDEAQDIGQLHGFLLELLIEAGSTVSLIGDPNQAIYEFAYADGTFLRNFNPGPTGRKQNLTRNRRSVQTLVEVSNNLSGTSYKATRSFPARKCGAFLFIYNSREIIKIRSTFAELLLTYGYPHKSAAILCRGRKTVPLIVGADGQCGIGATEHFARAALCRDQKADIAEAFRHTVDGVIRLLEAPLVELRASVLSGTNELHANTLRRLIWSFMRSEVCGLPPAVNSAKSVWLPKLKTNVEALLASIEEDCEIPRNKNWKYSVTARSLADSPLYILDLTPSEAPLPEVKTVHQAKGQSIDAVLFLLRPKDVKKLLAGPVDEEGRIGYVGLTRARDLLLVAVPSSTKKEVLEKFRTAGFSDWS